MKPTAHQHETIDLPRASDQARFTPVAREDIIEALAEIHQDEAAACRAPFISKALKRVGHEVRVVYLRVTFPVRQRIAAVRYGK